MMNESEFDDLAAEVAHLNGLTLAKAGELVMLVGDTPEFLLAERRVVVRDAEGREVAQIRWPE
jgi:hypothetical protein